MLKSAKNAAVSRSLWRINLEKHLFCLTRLSRSYREITASFRLHSQTVAVSVHKLRCFTSRVRYCRWRDVVGSN